MFIREFFYKKPEMILIAAGAAGSFLLFIIQRAFGVPSFSWAALTMLYIALAIAQAWLSGRSTRVRILTV